MVAVVVKKKKNTEKLTYTTTCSSEHANVCRQLCKFFLNMVVKCDRKAHADSNWECSGVWSGVHLSKLIPYTDMAISSLFHISSLSKALNQNAHTHTHTHTGDFIVTLKRTEVPFRRESRPGGLLTFSLISQWKLRLSHGASRLNRTRLITRFCSGFVLMMLFIMRKGLGVLG